MPLVIIVNKKTSQLIRKAYEDVDYTVVIAVVHLHKRIIIIVQKLTLVVEVISPIVFLLIATARSLLRRHVHVCGDANAGPHDVAKHYTTRMA